MTMLLEANPELAITEVNIPSNRPATHVATPKPVTRRHLARSLHLRPRVAVNLTRQTPLVECRKCHCVATYGDLCLTHWQEHARYGAFSPVAQLAVAAFHLSQSAAYV